MNDPNRDNKYQKKKKKNVAFEVVEAPLMAEGVVQPPPSATGLVQPLSPRP